MRWVTPEGFTFQLPLAGVSTRCLAWLVDAAVIGTAMQMVSLVGNALAIRLPGLATALGIGVGFALSLLYAAALEWWWNGQTVGKRVLGLRVMDAHGLPLSGAQALMRNLLRVVDALPALYLVGGVACLASRHAQRVGDQVAGTVVARTGPMAAPGLGLGTGGSVAQKYNSFREYPHLALRLREGATPEEAGVAMRALARREELAPERRAALYRELVEHFQARVAFPPAATEALSDEQYLRNVVGVLFARTWRG